MFKNLNILNSNIGPKSLTYPQNRYTNSIAPGTSMSGLNSFSRMGTLRSSNSNTFSRMRNRSRLRSGQSQMSVASYDVGGYHNANQVFLSNTALHQVRHHVTLKWCNSRNSESQNMVLSGLIFIGVNQGSISVVRIVWIDQSQCKCTVVLELLILYWNL